MMTALMEVREVMEARFVTIDIMSSSWLTTAWDWFGVTAAAVGGGACIMAPLTGVEAKERVSWKK